MRSASERAERNKGLSLSGKIDGILVNKKNLLLGFLKKKKIKTRNIRYFVSNIKIVKQNTTKEDSTRGLSLGTSPPY